MRPQDILDKINRNLKDSKNQTAGSYNYYTSNPYNYKSDFLKSLQVLPTLINDMEDPDLTKEEKLQKQVGAVGTLAGGLLNDVGNSKVFQKNLNRYRGTQNRMNDYLPVPYEREGYQSNLVSPYTYQGGGTNRDYFVRNPETYSPSQELKEVVIRPTSNYRATQTIPIEQAVQTVPLSPSYDQNTFIANSPLKEYLVTAPAKYDFQKTRNHMTSLADLEKDEDEGTNFTKRAKGIEDDYITSKDKQFEKTPQGKGYIAAKEEWIAAEKSRNPERVEKAREVIDSYGLDTPHLDCLGSSCMYADRYFKKDFKMPGMAPIKERLLKYTNQDKAGMSAWNIFGALKMDDASQIDYSITGEQNQKGIKSKYKDLPKEVRDKIVIGSNIGFTDNLKGRDGLNEKNGIVGTRHHAIVVGFDKEGTPILFDYGNAVTLDKPVFKEWNIGVIGTPKEYREKNIDFKEYSTNPVFFNTSTKGFYDKDLKHNNKEDKDVNEISKSLMDNKASIQKDLGMNDYDYNKLSSYLMALMKQETSNYNTASRINDFFAGKLKRAPSLGAFQINTDTAKAIIKKYNLDHNKQDKFITDTVDEFGDKVPAPPRGGFIGSNFSGDIKKTLKDPYKAAIIAMYMAHENNITKEAAFKKGIPRHWDVPVTKPFINMPVLNKIFKTTKKENTPGNNPELTEDEKFFYMWNSPNKLRTGQAVGDSNYVKNNLKYLEDVGIQFQSGGVTELGYKDNSPYRNAPYLDINSPNITMKGVSQPLMGIADTGQRQMMYPGRDYNFPGANKVREIPVNQVAGKSNNIQNLGGIEFDTNNSRQIGRTQRDNPILEVNGVGNSKYKVIRNADGTYRWFDGKSRDNLLYGMTDAYEAMKPGVIKSAVGLVSGADNYRNLLNAYEANVNGKTHGDLDVAKEAFFAMPILATLEGSSYKTLNGLVRTHNGGKVFRKEAAYQMLGETNKNSKYQTAGEYNEEDTEEPTAPKEVDDSSGQYDYSTYENIKTDEETFDEDDLPFTVTPEGEEYLNSRPRYKIDMSVFSNFDDDVPAETSNIIPVVTELRKLGLNPSSINTGQHNTGSKHYQNKAVDLGLNTTFGGNPKKMEDFIQYYNKVLKPKYPNLSLHDERKQPKGQKVWSGNHLHLEID